MCVCGGGGGGRIHYTKMRCVSSVCVWGGGGVEMKGRNHNSILMHKVSLNKETA